MGVRSEDTEANMEEANGRNEIRTESGNKELVGSGQWPEEDSAAWQCCN